MGRIISAEEIKEWNGPSPYFTCPSYEKLSQLIGRPQKMTSEKLVRRFFKNVERNEWGCWPWLGAKNPGGYGIFTFNNRHTLAHRVSYLIRFGKECLRKHGQGIDGMYIMHKCDNPACVNPEHLDVGDAVENNADMRRKGRDRHYGSYGRNWGERNGQAILRREDVREIRNLLKEGNLSQAKIGRMFGVKGGTIYMIKHNLNWRNLE